ncbi:PAS domain-containing hybrid sensor histidine kinase/response regulator [Methylobacterium sp. WSM2598]|uniref:PAS domain-containing hybrid sensor histidine kinase/response regulator n=1 Tax=Methylobacterium sp. WSM2598 TaxID=398261 RepID=UPI0003648631|nr:PAS domain S-box protein [Methylobacterium sp. WSM2598]
MPKIQNARHHAQLPASGSSAARQDYYQAVIESAVDFAIFAMDRDGRVTDWNRGATHILGWSRSEILGQLAHVIFTPEDQAEGRPEQEMRTALECGRAMDERWHQRKDGSRFWAVGELMPLRTEAGEVEGFVKILRDRTLQHKQEERLRAQASTLQTITDHVSEAVFQLDADGNITFANPAAEAMFGWSVEELLGRNLHETLHHHYPDGRPYPADGCPLSAALRTGEVLRGHEEVFFRRDGAPRHVLCTNAPVRVDGRIASTVLTITDIAERKQAEVALAETTRRLNAVLDNATVAVFLMDDRQHCAYMNAAAERLTGYRLAETQGRPLHDVIHHTRPDGSAFPLHECAIDRAFPENAHTQGEEVFVHKDGHFYPVAFNASPVHDEASRTIGTIIEVRDISAEKAREAALRESTERLASERHALEVLNRTGTRVAAELDLDRLVQTVVDAGVELTGAQFGAFFYNVLDEAGGKYMLYALSGAERSAFERFGMPRATAVFAPTFLGEGVIRSGDILKDERYGRSAPHHGMPEGHLPVRSYLAVPVTSRSGEVIGGLFFGHPEPDVFSARCEELMSGLAAQAAIGIDNARLFQAAQQAAATLEKRVEERTAELQRTEEALRQSQKMEAVGQLTGGLAHDFNNLLTGISGSLELLQTRMAQGRLTDLDRYINAAQGASKRAAALTHRLLAFSRRQTLDPKPTDVNGLIFGMEELIRRTVGPAITIEVVGAAGLWPALVDPPQLENALLNLCINARDAMPEGGRITIETANKWLDDRAARERDLPPGQYLSLCVTDTGTGMTPEVIAKAFDPFFTTKPIGQGTGLGLSMIYGFVRQSGGQVRIYSEVGQGTTMCLYLPRYYGEAEEGDVLAGLSDAPRAEQGETVLIVDDEPSVRMLVTEVLEDLGYTAIEAADGPAGLKVLQSGVRVDLLVTDVGLPGGMNGRQVADAGREVRPGLKVLFITGYAENAAIGNGYLEPGMQVLTKPFVMESLAARIRAMIEE